MNSTRNINVAARCVWPSLNMYLYIEKKVLDVFDSFRQLIKGYERGGQLFVSKDWEGGLVLVRATLPHVDDTSSEMSLEFNKSRCCTEILNANSEELRLIGYWHTHPQNIPMISSQDISSFRTFSKNNINHLASPVAVVVGRQKDCVWLMRDTPLQAIIEML